MHKNLEKKDTRSKSEITQKEKKEYNENAKLGSRTYRERVRKRKIREKKRNNPKKKKEYKDKTKLGSRIHIKILRRKGYEKKSEITKKEKRDKNKTVVHANRGSCLGIKPDEENIIQEKKD